MQYQHENLTAVLWETQRAHLTATYMYIVYFVGYLAEPTSGTGAIYDQTVNWPTPNKLCNLLGIRKVESMLAPQSQVSHKCKRYLSWVLASIQHVRGPFNFAQRSKFKKCVAVAWLIIADTIVCLFFRKSLQNLQVRQ